LQFFSIKLKLYFSQNSEKKLKQLGACDEQEIPLPPLLPT